MLPIHSELKIIHQRSCVAYDPKSGSVRHVHHITIFEGGDIPTDNDVRARTIEVARSAVPPTALPEDLATLLVSRDEVRPESILSVDLKSRQLVTASPTD